MPTETEGCACCEGAKCCLQEGQILIFKKVDVCLMPVQQRNGGGGNGAAEAKNNKSEPQSRVISIY